MRKKRGPELNILKGTWAEPDLAECDECHATFSTTPSMGTSPVRVNALKAEFFKHLQEKHPRKKREDFSQAAFRVVKEATKDK